MSEDSKKMANTGAHGMKLTFHAHPSIPSDEFVSLIEDLLNSVGDKVNEMGKVLIGHAKTFITTPHGTLKVNLIDTDLGAETLNRLSSPEVEEGEMKYMCVLMGLSDHEVEEIMEESLESLKDRMELRIEEHQHDEHENEHQHQHDEHEHQQ